MKRRAFLQYTGLTSAGLLVPGFMKAFDLNHANLTGKRLIVIQLSGGNDGLNTLVPFTNDIYYQARPKLGIAKDQVLRISDSCGFHPAMSGFRKLFDEGCMSIFNAVGYPNPNRSHFRSMDIWHTGSGAEEYLNTGWLGRVLDSNCKGSELPWYAIEVDDTLSLALKGQSKSGFAVQDPMKLKKQLSDPFYSNAAMASPQGDADSELSFLYKTLASTRSGADYIASHVGVKSTNTNYPTHAFGKHLQQIAGLINEGIESKVFYTGLSGFDTHIRQADVQQRLLGILSDSVSAMADELKAAGNWNDTAIMVFSEFGRRVKQNASQGTDHGTANQVYLLGGNLQQAGIRNDLISLEDLEDGDLKQRLDFRNIYASVIDHVLGINHQDILNRKFEGIGLI
jgi:uncharacterized protein (DUF1501 family)